METCCDYVDDEPMYVSTDERKKINLLLKLKEKYPTQVNIIKYPEENQGTLYCTCPALWLSIIPPRKAKTLTEEQRIAAAERLKLANMKKRGKNNAETNP